MAPQLRIARALKCALVFRPPAIACVVAALLAVAPAAVPACLSAVRGIAFLVRLRLRALARAVRRDHGLKLSLLALGFVRLL
jgi:hypothetical protein